jgi:hypothetical protein
MEKTKDKVSCAYKEIYEILKIFPKELVDRIPKYKLDYIKQNMDESYEYNITKETFDGKTMLDETAAILAILFRDYWATEKQKIKIINYHNTQREKMANEIKEKYDPENVFKRRNIEQEKAKKTKEALAVVEYKENIFKKLFNKIKEIFKR